MYLNKVELIGFLGSDAETRTIPNGNAVTTFSLATKTSYMKDGNRQERTEWHRIQIWGRLGEYAAAFKKGAHVCIEGELRSREYESQGVKVRTTTSSPTRSSTSAPASATQPRLQKRPPYRRPP